MTGPGLWCPNDVVEGVMWPGAYSAGLQEHVLGLEVTVSDLQAVQVEHGVNHLHQGFADVMQADAGTCVEAAIPHCLLQAPSITELHDDARLLHLSLKLVARRSFQALIAPQGLILVCQKLSRGGAGCLSSSAKLRQAWFT